MAYFAILRIKLQNTIGIFNDMKDLLDRFEVAYTSIFDEDPEEEKTEKEETIATRVIKRCKKSIHAWAMEDQTVATLFGR